MSHCKRPTGESYSTQRILHFFPTFLGLSIPFLVISHRILKFLGAEGGDDEDPETNSNAPRSQVPSAPRMLPFMSRL